MTQWTKADEADLEERKQEVLGRLADMGWGDLFKQWENELEEQQKNEPQELMPTPFSRPIKNAGSLKMIPAGFSEFRPHPRWKTPVRRCLAKNRRRADGQCCYFSLRDNAYCQKHAHVFCKKPNNGRHFLVHGNETLAIRAERKKASETLKTLNKELITRGLAEPRANGRRQTKSGGLTDSDTYKKRRQRWIKRVHKELNR